MTTGVTHEVLWAVLEYRRGSSGGDAPVVHADVLITARDAVLILVHRVVVDAVQRHAGPLGVRSDSDTVDGNSQATTINYNY